MSPLASILFRTGLSMKLDQVKRAVAAYVHDRSEQGSSIALAYAAAAGLYAAAGVFLVAALLVGAAALFRWVEIHYGMFPAFGALGGLLILFAIVFAVLAAGKLKQPAKEIPGLGSRLRVAVSAKPEQAAGARLQQSAAKVVDLAKDTAKDAASTATRSIRNAADTVDSKASAGAAAARRTVDGASSGRSVESSDSGTGPLKAGLLMAVTMAGWALARRRSLAKSAPVIDRLPAKLKSLRKAKA